MKNISRRNCTSDGGRDFFKLINRVDANIVTFRDIYDGADLSKGRYLILRHDVDVNLNMACVISSEEKKRAMKSTFYILHRLFTGEGLRKAVGRLDNIKDEYFNYSNELKKKLLFLKRTGNDIGLHNNVIGEYLLNGGDMKDILERPLFFMRDIGLDISCTMPHGDALCSKNGLTNHDLWTEYDSVHDVVKIRHQRLSYKEYFDYDVSLMMNDKLSGKKVYYISDSGGIWYIRDDNIPFSATIEFEGGVIGIRDGRKMIRYIDKFNKEDNAVMILLLHPRWWEVR